MSVTPLEYPTAPAQRSAPTDARIASLDGLRGIAVALVVLFHVGLGPFRGGFVGVTVFFTLSGYLITTRTLVEVDRRGRFSVPSFVERRVRRLVPASMLCLAGTITATHLVGTAGQLAQLRGDVIAAAANVANWRFLLAGTSYADLFAGPSPLNHYWSLAIEEQFYIVFPIAAALVVRVRASRRAATSVALVALASVASLAVAITTSSTDRFYYGTDTRMFELLAGVALALWLHRSAAATPTRAWLAGLADLAGGVALAVVVVCAVIFDNGAPSFARGGAQLVAMATAVVLWALIRHAPRLSAACSVRPLVWLGKVSYGVYLYHWPVVALCPRRVGPLQGSSLAVVQAAASVLLAAVSWRVVEQKVMSRRLLPRRPGLALSWLATAGLVIAAASGVTAAAPADATPKMLQGGTGLAAPDSLPAPTAAPGVGPRPLRLAVAGDSTATVFAEAAVRYATQHPDELVVEDLSMAGCAITRVEAIRHYQGEAGQTMTQCGLWPLALDARVRGFQPDVSVVFLAMMEQADQQERRGGAWRNVLQPAWADHQLSEFDLLATGLHITGAPSIWADVPYMKFQPNLPWISDDPARTDALNAVVRELDERRDDVSVADYASRLNRPDRTVDTSVRPDGIHLTDGEADRLVADWLIPLLDTVPRIPASGTVPAGQDPPSTTEEHP